MQRIVHTITSDEALTARVIRVVNSALFGIQRRVTSVQQATVLLGKGAITQIAAGIAALHMETAVPADLPLSRQSFWRHSMGTAFLARQLGEDVGREDPEEAFTAGLLHDIGKLVLMGYLGPEYTHVLEYAAEEKKPLNHMEREMLGVDHDDIGQELCERWKLSASMQAAVSVHRNATTEPLKRIVQAANASTKAAGIGNSGNAYVQLDQLPLREMQQAARRADTLSEVRREVARIERAFREGAGTTSDPAAGGKATASSRGTILIQVKDKRLAAMLAMVVGGLGWRPYEAPSGTTETPSNVVQEAVAGITERSASGDAVSTMPQLDVAAWRTGHAQKHGAGAVLNVAALRSWVAQELDTVSAERT